MFTLFSSKTFKLVASIDVLGSATERYINLSLILNSLFNSFVSWWLPALTTRPNNILKICTSKA